MKFTLNDKEMSAVSPCSISYAASTAWTLICCFVILCAASPSDCLHQRIKIIVCCTATWRGLFSASPCGLHHSSINTLSSFKWRNSIIWFNLSGIISPCLSITGMFRDVYSVHGTVTSLFQLITPGEKHSKEYQSSYKTPACLTIRVGMESFVGVMFTLAWTWSASDPSDRDPLPDLPSPRCPPTVLCPTWLTCMMWAATVWPPVRLYTYSL